jgi:hypothetical protein
LAKIANFENLGRATDLGDPSSVFELTVTALVSLSLVFERLAIVTPSRAAYRALATARLNRPPSKGDAGNSNHSFAYDNDRTGVYP